MSLSSEIDIATNGEAAQQKRHRTMDITIEAPKFAFGVRQKIRSCIASHCNVVVILEWSWIFQRFYFYCMFASSCSVLMRDSWPFHMLQLSIFGPTVRQTLSCFIFQWLQPKEPQHCVTKPTLRQECSSSAIFASGADGPPDKNVGNARPSTEQPRLPFLHFLRRHGGLRWLIVLVGLFLREQIPLIQQHPGIIGIIGSKISYLFIYSAKSKLASQPAPLRFRIISKECILACHFLRFFAPPCHFQKTIPIFLKSSSVDGPFRGLPWRPGLLSCVPAYQP